MPGAEDSARFFVYPSHTSELTEAAAGAARQVVVREMLPDGR